MKKYSAWIEGYGAALIKLGWDPKRVMQIKEMLAREVPAAHARHAAGTAQRTKLLAGSPKFQQMAAGLKMKPEEFAHATLGVRSPGMAPPVPVAEKIRRATAGSPRLQAVA